MDDNDQITVLAELYYQDPGAALEWLAAAFGFETRMVVTDAEGRIVFAESGWGRHTVAVIPEMGALGQSPRAVGGVNTQAVQMRGTTDIDAHCARARATGAVIVSEPEDLFFGDRAYVATDLEGHLWNFGQRIPGAGGPPPEGWSVRFPSRDS
jgi:uncharacterized glyoxalase superfamily protein PhnB